MRADRVGAGPSPGHVLARQGPLPRVGAGPTPRVALARQGSPALRADCVGAGPSSGDMLAKQGPPAMDRPAWLAQELLSAACTLLCMAMGISSKEGDWLFIASD